MSERDDCGHEGGDAAKDSEITISKLDAARSQLETAISLFFQEKDVVSIHTLVAAAYTIIQDVNRNRGGSPMAVKDLIPRLVPEHKRKSVRKKLNCPENFFKHANQDPDATLPFRASMTPLLILDAAHKYHEITNETPAGVNVFMWWLSGTMPELLLRPPILQETAVQVAPAFRQIPKQCFLVFLEKNAPGLPDFFGPDTHKGYAEFIAGIQQRLESGA